MVRENHDRFEFTVSLAGFPMRVICRHEENRAFLEDYLTDRAPLFTVEPTAADLEKARRGFVAAYGIDDGAETSFSERFLENNALHALIAERLATYDTLLFHGSALCMDGQAFVFTAPSGTGKSTHARLWRRVFGDRVWMINDDKPLLRLEEGGVRVYGSPWDGKHRLSRNASAPLRAILRLYRSPENRLAPMERADAFQTLLGQGFASETPDSARHILALKTRLLDSTAFYSLYCNMEPEAALCAWKGVGVETCRCRPAD